MYLKSFQDFRSEISIIELALSVGYQLRKKEGLKWPVLKDEVSGEKIIIVNPLSPSNQGYFNPNDPKDKGTLINFVKNRLGSIFPYENSKSEISNINTVLYNYLHLDIPEKTLHRRAIEKIIEKHATKEFKVPEDISPLKDAGYLLSRGILDETLNDPTFKGKIFNVRKGEFNNIGFPYFDADQKISGYELRNKNYKYMVEGSNRSSCIWLSNIPNPVDFVVLSESPIDALSYHQLKGKKNSLYVAFAGAVGDEQIDTLKAILKSANKIPGFKFISAVDNDIAGERYTEKFKNAFSKELIVDKPFSKDFNEDLKRSKERIRGMRM